MQNVHVLCLDSRTKRWLKQSGRRYRQLKTSGYFWECWWARAVSSYSWRDRHSMKNLLFLSPNQPPSSLQQRFSSSYAQDIVTDFEPPNVWTTLKTSGQHLLKGDSWTSLLTCAAQAPQVEHGLLYFYMKMISSCHSSSFAGWLNLLYNLYLVIALWSFEELWFWHWKTLLCNTWFSTGRGRLDWKKFSMQHGCRWDLFSPSWCWALWQHFWTAFSTGGKATTVSAVYTYISTHPVLLRLQLVFSDHEKVEFM